MCRCGVNYLVFFCRCCVLSGVLVMMISGLFVLISCVMISVLVDFVVGGRLVGELGCGMGSLEICDCMIEINF